MLNNSKTNILSLGVSSGNQMNRTPKQFVKHSRKPPPSDWMKWNTDASKVMITNLTTIGVVCRDSSGSTIASLGKKIGEVPVLVAEAIAIREALTLARDRNTDKLVIENDS